MRVFYDDYGEGDATWFVYDDVGNPLHYIQEVVGIRTKRPLYLDISTMIDDSTTIEVAAVGGTLPLSVIPVDEGQ